MLTLSSIVDLISFVPYWVQFIVEWFRSGNPFMTESVSFIAAIRILRVFQLLKANKYVHAIEILKVVFKRNRDILLTTGSPPSLLTPRQRRCSALTFVCPSHRCNCRYSLFDNFYCVIFRSTKRQSRHFQIYSRRHVHCCAPSVSTRI